jgi:hypothetical protein
MFTSAGVFRVVYSYQQFIQNDACMRIADPHTMNFIPGLNTDDFVLEFDMQSTMTALGVNYGVIDSTVLQEVPFTRSPAQINGNFKTYASFYNPRYPNMNAITCFLNMDTTSEYYEYNKVDVCVLRIGDTFFYPAYNHIGYYDASLDETLYCSCSEEVLSNADFSEQCRQFMMVTGRCVLNTVYV